MKHTLLLAAAVTAAVASAKTSTPAGWTDDYDAALKQAAKEKKLVLADFSGSDWCCWCQRLDQEVFDTETFRKEATNSYVLLMVDSPNDKSLLSEKAKAQNPDLVKKFKIRGFPTVLVLDAKGEIVHKTGYKSGGPEKYLKMLDLEIKYGPDIKKYITPIEEVFRPYDIALRKEMGAIRKKVEEKYPELKADASAEEQEKRWKAMGEEGQRLMSEVMEAKLAPLCESLMAKAQAMAVPEHLKEKKEALIARYKQNLAMMKTPKGK